MRHSIGPLTLPERVRTPHLDDAIRVATDQHDTDPPPPEFHDRIPDDLYGQLQALLDDELEADHDWLIANGLLKS